MSACAWTMGRRGLATVAVALATLAVAQAQTDRTWLSATSGNWNTAANWSGTDVPDSITENAVIAVNSGSNYTVSLTSSMYPSLSLNQLSVTGQRANLVIDGVAITTAASGEAFLLGPSTTPLSTVTMTGGSLNTATLRIKGVLYVPSTTALVTLNSTPVTANRLVMDNASKLVINGNATSSFIVSTSNVFSDAKVELNGGNIAFGNVLMTGYFQDSVGKTQFKVQGATVTASQVSMDRTGGGQGGALLEVSSGSLTCATGEYGYRVIPAGEFFAVRVKGTGRLSYTSQARFGVMNDGGGLLEVQGGIFEARNLSIGTSGGKGWYNQTGGTATITGTLTLSTDSDAGTVDNGTRQFVVGNGATMVMTGAGMAKSGTLDWITSFTAAGNLHLGGTLRFAPDPSVMNQNLLAFGADTGTTAGANSFLVGVLDLTTLPGAGATLTVLPSGTFDNNALYVNNLLGLTPADVGTHIVSTVPVYYDSKLNPIFQYGTYTLTGGGLFQPFNVPEPTSLVLLGLAGLLALRRRSCAA